MSLAAPPSTGYTTTQVCELTGLSYRQVDWWDRTGMISPSIKQAGGSGYGRERVYSSDDVEVLHAIAELLKTGVSLRAIREAMRHPDGLFRYMTELGQSLDRAHGHLEGRG